MEADLVRVDDNGGDGGSWLSWCLNLETPGCASHLNGIAPGFLNESSTTIFVTLPWPRSLQYIYNK